MENKVLNAFAAITDIDDDLVLEGLEELKPSKHAKPFSGYLKYFAAAAAALVLTCGVLLAVKSFGNKPSEPKDNSAFSPPFSTSKPLPEKTEHREYSLDRTNSPGEPFEHMTPDPSFAPQATGEPIFTPVPTDSEPTSAPIFPEPTDLPSPTATPQATSGTTAEATTAPSPTPSPTASAAPTQTVSPTPSPTAAATDPIIEPTFEPSEPPDVEYLSYDTLTDFIEAVRTNAHPMLEGIDCYYTPSSAAYGRSLKNILVSIESVTYSYRFDYSKFTLAWIRNTGASQTVYDRIINDNQGNWYGELFIYTAANGNRCAVRMDNGHLLRFAYYRSCTDDQMAAYCDMIRFAF